MLLDFHIKLQKQFLTLIIIMRTIEQQISISERFLKNHVTLKPGVMMLKIQH